MSQIFGEFIEEFPPNHHCLELTFNTVSRTSQRQWRNHRLCAYYIADYFANIVSIDKDDPDGANRIKECKNSISYIGNELLENAVKFQEMNDDYPVTFGIYYIEDSEKLTAVIFTNNSINAHGVAKLQAFIQELLSSDTQELYVQQLEKIAAEEDSKSSGIGLLTIINDYSAKLGWEFELESTDTQIMTVTTMAQIIV
ncbi:MAG: DUF6272 family protein [Gloeotrichia echinulata DVL01]|jgi:hypothetical protein|nr:ATP-binding protein [Gloeotrichia echinulata DEX184]